MTEDRPAFRRAVWIALISTGVLLQACAKDAAPAATGARIYAADVTGKARSCEVPAVKPADGQTTDTAIKLGNDGGWCGLLVRQPSAKPFDAGLLSARPAHGNVRIHYVGDETRIDYTPDHGFAGADSFSVRLIPGDALLRIAVTVTAPTGKG